MSTREMFDSQLRSDGALAGVFEFDGRTGYFYLYKIEEPQGKRVLGAIRVLSGIPNFDQKDIAICWDDSESKVGLRIRGELWAAFDASTGAGYGGGYNECGQAEIPLHIAARFGSRRNPN
jgi:hypothetical protein